MLTAAVVLALLSTGPIAEPQSVSPGTLLRVQATVCFRQEDMHKIVDAEVRTGNGVAVFASLGGCGNFCINAVVVREERRFLFKGEHLFAVFEVRGLNPGSPPFWAATAILPTGQPIPVAESAHQARCEELTPA